VTENWEKASKIGLERQRIKSLEVMKAKAQKKALEAENISESKRVKTDVTAE